MMADDIAPARAPHRAQSAPGSMARLIRDRDWSDSPIGAPEQWPQSLKTAVGMMLSAVAQIVLFWGPEFEPPTMTHTPRRSVTSIRARFFSTKEVGQGTGPGLSMVYGFVRQSGSHLVLHWQEGTGTAIEIFLPRSGKSAQSRPPEAADGKLPRGDGERILLCEDDEGVRLFSSETLKDLGYELIEARDATEALALTMEHRPIGMLFTDVVLPGGRTGADLARDVRKLQPDLNALFTTS
jgi:CheY-like chemotaxis protein